MPLRTTESPYYMSVYTAVDQQALRRLERLYPLGNIRNFEGIREGVQNTNYFIYAQNGDYVLTIFESINRAQVERSMEFMHFLATHELPSSDPLPSVNGHYVEDFNGKPMAIVKRVAGTSVEVADEQQLQSLAHALAKWHIAVQHYAQRWPTRFDHAWRLTTAQRVLTQLDAQQQHLLQQQLALAQNGAYERLPHGIIHADLFRDNALFEGHRVAGIIDLYDIHYGPLLFDIAIIINDWCLDTDGYPDHQRARHFLRGYHHVRCLNASEIELLPAMLQKAALRFWLSRLQDELFPKQASLAAQKNPREFETILRFWADTSSNPAMELE